MLGLLDRPAAAHLPRGFIDLIGSTAAQARLFAGPAGQAIGPRALLEHCDDLYSSAHGWVERARANPRLLPPDTQNIIGMTLRLVESKLVQLRGAGDLAATVLDAQVERRRDAVVVHDDGDGEPEQPSLPEAPPSARGKRTGGYVALVDTPPAPDGPEGEEVPASRRTVESWKVDKRRAAKKLNDLRNRAAYQNVPADEAAKIRRIVPIAKCILGIDPKGAVRYGEIPGLIDQLRAMLLDSPNCGSTLTKLLVAIGDQTDERDLAQRVRLSALSHEIMIAAEQLPDHALKQLAKEIARDLGQIEDCADWRERPATSDLRGKLYRFIEERESVEFPGKRRPGQRSLMQEALTLLGGKTVQVATQSA